MADNTTPDRTPDFCTTAKRMGNGLATLLATVFGGSLVLGKEQAEATERKEREQGRLQLWLEITRQHPKYSECMYDIIEFQRKAASDSDPDAYAKVFKSEMDMAERPSRAKRVNSCRGLTKDYWRTAYGYMDSLEMREFAHQHERFTKFVKPLDTPYADDSSEALYDLANYTPSSG